MDIVKFLKLAREHKIFKKITFSKAESALLDFQKQKIIQTSDTEEEEEKVHFLELI